MTAGGVSPARGVPAGRHAALVSLARSSGVAALILVAYFVVPLTRFNGSSWVRLGAGLALVTAVLAWHLREITRSPYPRVRAVEALATGVTLFFTVFATTYFVMGRADPSSFTQSLTRLDAMYFTVTIFATVGFGDIAAVSEAARAVATLQMVADLILVGFVARMLVNAVQIGLGRPPDQQ